MALPTQPNTLPIQEPAPAKFGEKGFGKGKPKKQKGTPRTRITGLDGRILAFLSQFPASTTATLSLINTVAGGNFSPENNQLPERTTIISRMRRLEKMGMVEKYRNKTRGTTHYGATEEGWHTAQVLGYYLPTYRSLEGLSIERLNHYSMTAMVAGEFASPINFFENALGIKQVELEQLISEKQLRHDLSEVEEQLKQEGKTALGRRKTFGEWRAETLTEAHANLQNNSLAPEDILEFYPALRCLGWKHQSGKALKNLHIPDLVINLDTYRTSNKAESLLIEIELNKKSFANYISILQTYAQELKHGLIYDKVIYFTTGRQVENILRKVDRQQQLGLFDRGQIIVLPLTNPEGEIIKPKTHITIGD